jgi:2,3-bisphosphoglycerate-dependent phosphoglycerate mutase
MHLYLIRHGQSYVNLPEWDWSNGTPDQPLTELGERQADALARWIPRAIPVVDVLYASTMRRATQTAQQVALAYNCALIPDDRVREIGNNQRDHTAWDYVDLPAPYADYWATARPFSPTLRDAERSETFMHARMRVGLFVEEIVQRHRGQTVLVVCHGGVIDCVFDHVFNVGSWRRCELWTSNTGVGHFEYMEHPGREVWRLHYQNRVDHLNSEMIS